MKKIHTALINFLDSNGGILLFITYYYILPVIVPIGIVFLFSNYENTGLFITQTTSLFIVVSSFTNIGFLTSKSQTNYEFKKYEKEFYIMSSIILGIFSLIIFFNSYLSEYSIPVISTFMTLLILFLYYYNPHIMYSLNNDSTPDQKGRKDVNEDLESEIGGI